MAARKAGKAGKMSRGIVSVRGYGDVTTTPDVASVTVGVEVTKPTLLEAQGESTDQMSAVIDSIKSIGIASNDIRTTNYNVGIRNNYNRETGQSEFAGYEISNRVSVIVRDLSKVDKLLGGVVAAGANSIYGIAFGVIDPGAVESEARAAAVADAKTRAEELARAAGVKLGRVISISEGVDHQIPEQESVGKRVQALRESPPPIESGSGEVTVEVQVTYELVQKAT